MKRRIFGLEYELGLIARQKGSAKLKFDEAAALLFQDVSAYGIGLNANIWTTNGCRLYIDTGFHPELSTAECDSLDDLILIDRASELLYHEAALAAAARYKEEHETDITFYIYKNNVDFHGNGFGCHENYLVDRGVSFSRLAEALIPFFVTRQIFAGTGKFSQKASGKWEYGISSRSLQIAQEVAGITTGTRPIINTRDEPHADGKRYRRLHIIVGDSNMSCIATKLKMASAGIVLDLIEGCAIDDNFIESFSLQSPVSAIKDIAHDLTLREPLKRKKGPTITAPEIQAAYLEVALNPKHQQLINPDLLPFIPVWADVVDKLSKDPDLAYGVAEWVTKRELVESYAASRCIKPDDPKYGLIDLQYHDISPRRGLFRKQEVHALAAAKEGGKETERLRFAVDHSKINDYKYLPPIKGRPLVRGTLIALAQMFRLPMRADWTYVKTEKAGEYNPMLLMKDPRNLDEKAIMTFVKKGFTEDQQYDHRSIKLLGNMYANLN